MRASVHYVLDTQLRLETGWLNITCAVMTSIIDQWLVRLHLHDPSAGMLASLNGSGGHFS